jgi:hypothetical protein
MPLAPKGELNTEYRIPNTDTMPLTPKWELIMVTKY